MCLGTIELPDIYRKVISSLQAEHVDYQQYGSFFLDLKLGLLDSTSTIFIKSSPKLNVLEWIDERMIDVIPPGYYIDCSVPGRNQISVHFYDQQTDRVLLRLAFNSSSGLLKEPIQHQCWINEKNELHVSKRANEIFFLKSTPPGAYELGINPSKYYPYLGVKTKNTKSLYDQYMFQTVTTASHTWDALFPPPQPILETDNEI